MRRHLVPFLVSLVAFLSSQADAGWSPLIHQPSFLAGPSFLLMDGRVLVNEIGTNGGTVHWWTLTPDANGSYVNGTWARVGDTLYDRLYFGSGVLSDGRVIVCGGEYSGGAYRWINNTEVFDPISNIWTEIPPPTGWANVGDAPAVVMPDGRFFIGSDFDSRTAFYDPATASWVAGPNKLNSSSDEETWTLLPDGSVLTWNCFGHPGTQRYIPTTNAWIDCGNTPADLVLSGSLETGPGLLMPSGNVFCMGGPPVSCIYTPPASISNPGTWSLGPVPPQVNGDDMGAEDAPGAVLPNGNVLLALGPVVPGGGTFSAPTYFFEYDGNSITQVATPPNNGGPPFVTTLLILPTGEVFETVFDNTCYVYTNGGAPNPAWKPTVTAVPSVMETGFDYVTTGTQYTGVTNGSSYGDEVNNATNYPIVRVAQQSSGSVTYLRSFGVTTRAVSTGGAPISTHFSVAPTIAAGRYDFQVVACGIASDPVTVDIPNTFFATAFSVVDGNLVSGGLADLHDSDDHYLVVKPRLALSLVDPPIDVDVTATSTSLSPTFLAVSLEDSANTLGAVRTVSLLNVSTNQFEPLDTRAVGILDAVTLVQPQGNLSRFVNQSSGEVTVRLAYFRAGRLRSLPFQVSIDRAVVLGY